MEKRILYVIGQLGIGGSERQLTLTVEYMKSRGYLPAVAVWSYRAEDLYAERLARLGVTVFPLRGLAPQKVLSLAKVVREYQPGLVHSFSFFLNAAVWGACAGTPCVVLGSSRAELAREKVQLGLPRTALNANFPRFQVFNSMAAIKQAAEVVPLPLPPVRMHVPNGLDLNRFHPVDAPRNRIPVILGVGSLIPVKRWDRLIDAASVLRNMGVSFKVRILGAGPLHEALHNQVRSRELEEYVELPGPTSNVVAELHACNVVAHVSESEGAPNAVLEAMACARPVVAHPSGETAFIVIHNQTGLLVYQENPMALATALRTLLEDPDRCKTMGLLARKQMEAHHSVEASGQAMLNAYATAGWKV